MQFLSHNVCSCMLSVKGLRIATSGARVKYCSTCIELRDEIMRQVIAYKSL